MAEISKGGKEWEWICSLLITLNLYFVAAGYINYFQTRYQLITPLIPRSTLYDITENYMTASLIASGGLVAGTWLYFFRKKIPAIIVLAITAMVYTLYLYVFRK